MRMQYRSSTAVRILYLDYKWFLQLNQLLRNEMNEQIERSMFIVRNFSFVV